LITSKEGYATSGPERQLTVFEFGVNCEALGVGDRVGTGVNVKLGGSAGVNVLVGKLPAAIGVGTDDANSGKLQANINNMHAVKSIARWFFMVSPLADNLILLF
jgi:hypothetical protein